MQRVRSAYNQLLYSLTNISFGFVKYYHPAAAENCIRGFFHLGYQASYAQVSPTRNSAILFLTKDRNLATPA